MQVERSDTTLAVLGFLAALLMACMLFGQIQTGSSLLSFQSARPIETLTRKLAENAWAAPGLRLSIGLNTVFIVTYSAFFTLLAARFRPAIGPWAAGVGLGAFLFTALLDAVGTHHISEMLHALESQLPVSVWETQLEMALAGLRFHGTYLGSALFALGFMHEGKLGRWIAAMLWLGYLPLGAALAAYSIDRVAPLSLARYVFFVVSFFVSGVLFLRSAPRS